MAKLVVLAVLASLISAVSCQSWTWSIYRSWGYTSPRWGTPWSYNPAPTTWTTPPPPPSSSDLKVGYYAAHNCSNAENIVRAAVEKASAGILAGLIRLAFHDCFVRGCDASVLLEGSDTERQGFPNLSLRGFNIIDDAKEALEKECPGVVSCADIVTFAARDASYILSSKKINYAVPAGRFDGNVSRANDTLGQNLPPPFADLATLTKMFADKGLDQTDMVVLSGAHTVGISHCPSFSDRVHPPTSPSPDMEPTLAAKLNQTCDTPNNATTTVSQDSVTPDALDNQYYKNVLSGKVLFTSDAALNSSETLALVKQYAGSDDWNTAFGAAMVKMGYIGVKSSKEGEIRKKCGVVNKS
ncbi:hypothetical protein QYE76_063123 [Lolium multiflorum]|uniref:Peroxidase n=1 Tax=Lolium multiflorum TaxID=4521 RepID=A0AAD8W6R1_LOLMU|nr:hypothetical protein QYE76_063123 [Lolium multiflorum]